MADALFTIVRALRTVFVFEVLAVGLLIGGACVLSGVGAGLIVAGVCAALKSYELGGR
jgi:hypothetical protein